MKRTLTPQKAGNIFERLRRGIQRGFVGVAVGDWQGGLSAATRAGSRKRAGKSGRMAYFLPKAKNKPEQSELCSGMAPQVGLEPTTLRLTAACSRLCIFIYLSKAVDTSLNILILFLFYSFIKLYQLKLSMSIISKTAHMKSP